LLPEPTCDEYAGRGDSDNRHNEFQRDPAMDRLSDHRFVANYFRLYLHAAAMRAFGSVDLKMTPVPGISYSP
jgi:hypothetical protein